jgi:chorismate synthase
MILFQTARGALKLRELSTMSEMIAAEEIQSLVWGPEIIPTPKEMLIPIQHEGGLLAGAFTGEHQMVGLVFSFPTRDPAAHHSQMLATLPAWRGLGIGTRLKWFQRDWCLEHGITLVRWTVDPLRAANAQLNIHHLGATAAAYLPDYYGMMTGIDAGTPTDRLLVVWRLDDERTILRAASPLPDRGYPGAQPVNAVEEGRPTAPRLGVSDRRILLRLPEDFIRLLKTDPVAAQAWRLQTRELFTYYFARGYAITGFTRVPGPAYLLESGFSNHED